MNKKRLYFIQDGDRPMYVLAYHYNEAFDKWANVIRKENNMEVDEYIEQPDGISYLADSEDVIL